jgi:hypothetical protein
MKLAGMFLLVTGAALVFSAFALLPVGVPRAAFAVVAFAMQLVGLGLSIRGHYVSYEGQ